MILTCAEARDLLLDADLEELRAETDSALARHVRACPECALLAQQVLASQAALGHALETLTAHTVKDRATPNMRVRPASRFRIAHVAVPLAAAAALLLVVWRPDLTRREVLLPILIPAEYVPSAPVVNATGDHAVAVMQTSNPNITVIWQLEGAP